VQIVAAACLVHRGRWDALDALHADLKQSSYYYE
jgi:hypothetical protein